MASASFPRAPSIAAGSSKSKSYVVRMTVFTMASALYSFSETGESHKKGAADLRLAGARQILEQIHVLQILEAVAELLQTQRGDRHRRAAADVVRTPRAVGSFC